MIVFVLQILASCHSALDDAILISSGCISYLQQSKSFPFLAGQQYPLSPNALHFGFLLQYRGRTGAFVGGRTGVGLVGDSWQQSNSTPAAVGQQFPVKPKTAHLGLVLQVGRGLIPLQQSNVIPDALGQH
jgi:hypothetical protein